MNALVELHALLRAAHWLHWTAHWQSQGEAYYAKHMLFQRIYEAMPDEIDTLAEKLMQLFGANAVSPVMSLSYTSLWMQKWMGSGTFVTPAIALQVERDLQAAIKAAYDSLKQAGTLTLGMDDFLMAMANAHETNLYLLQQQNKIASMTAEHHFFDAPKNREVREFAQSKATSNVAGVGVQSIAESANDGKSKATEKKNERKAPPTPTEVIKGVPGGDDFSTLSRYVVQTEQPTDAGVPKSRESAPKHPKIQ